MNATFHAPGRGDPFMTGPNALLTDLYQLTMAQAYFELQMGETAVFELFVRRLPSSRRFLIAAGLEHALEYIEALHFTGADLEFLSGLGHFSQPFLEYLRTLRFTGSIHAMPEGTPCFADEPIVRITAPILEAQLLESRLINIVHFQTLIASKAARCVIAANGRRLIDFGMRRAHEADAAVYAARAAYLAGFDATATIAAGQRFGIPLSGTLAHSFIEAHDREEDAFRRFVLSQRAPTTLPIDTYDTQRATRLVATLARQLKAQGPPGHGIHAVRIDSGDLAFQARAVREILDGEGCEDIQIVLSGGLDEQVIDALVSAGVPVDAFGVGTSLDISADVPVLDMAYKLEEYAGKPRRKCSPGKATWPGAKQVFRERGADGEYLADHVVELGEQPAGQALLEEVMRGGQRVGGARTSLTDARAYCQKELEALPLELRDLRAGPSFYPAYISAALRSMAEQLDAEMRSS
jgi:nicotinate phosphoribosyltransferase